MEPRGGDTSELIEAKQGCSEEWQPGECPHCGADAREFRCWDCGGEGFHDNSDDLEWPTTDECETCNGKGGWTFCPTCDKSYDFGYSRILLDKGITQDVASPEDGSK